MQCFRISIGPVAQNKDVFDFVRAVRDYDGGAEAAVAAFHAESGRNLAFEGAMHTLTNRFAVETSKGPIQHADFCPGRLTADSEADVEHARSLLAGLDTLIVQDIFLTRTAEMADVVFPASVAWAESDGTVTSSERRVQRVRGAVPPPGCRLQRRKL